MLNCRCKWHMYRMEVTSLLFMLSTLSITPNRLQFFQYDRIELKCVANSTGWTVKRNTGSKIEECTFGWGTPSESSCIIEDAYPKDTGVYWCESKKESSKNITITVIAHGVILESPIDPVMEGNQVTIRCSYKGEDEYISKSDFLAAFYKDGVFIGTGDAGTMTFSALSKSDGGFYKCKHPSKGESRQSFLAVRVEFKKVNPTTLPPPPPIIPWARVISSVLLFILYNCILVLCIYIYRKWARGRTKRNPSVPELQP
ncbi:unnamed protein product [Oreochromis niloticus]|nr:unnamed protein product [Mustela putorius furo]